MLETPDTSIYEIPMNMSSVICISCVLFLKFETIFSLQAMAKLIYLLLLLGMLLTALLETVSRDCFLFS